MHCRLNIGINLSDFSLIRFADCTTESFLTPCFFIYLTAMLVLFYLSLFLQENNAIAIFDLLYKTCENIFPLGTKSWKNWYMDPSDMDYSEYIVTSFDSRQFYQDVNLIGILKTNCEPIIIPGVTKKRVYSSNWVSFTNSIT